MTTRRRGEGGFRRLGEGGVRDLGLHRSVAKRIEVQWAWLQAAGETIARRAPALGVTRGVLEIAVADARWSDALRRLLPRLAGRLAAGHPHLGVRRFRLVEAGRGGATPVAIPGLEDEPSR